MSRPCSNRGIALIGAMLVAAVIAAIAAALSVRDQLALQALARGREQATVNALTRELEVRAARVLAADAVASAHDSPDEAWQALRLEVSRHALTASARLRDAQARFNLNSLSFEPPDGPGTRLPQRGENQDGDPPATGMDERAPGTADAAAPATPADASGPGAATAPGAVQPELPPLPLPGTPVGALEACGDSGTCVRDVTGSGANAERVAALAGKSRPTDSPAAVSALAAVASAAGVTPPAAAPAPGVPAAEPPAANGSLADDSGQDDSGRGGSGMTDQQVAAARFVLLLQALDLPTEILPAVLDWLDADNEPRYPNGAEDEFYSLREPAYRAANRRFEEVSELRLVRGVTEEIYETLRPFVTVLDNPTPINVNTAAPEVLMSLAPGMDRSAAELLVRSRAVQPFIDLEALLSHPLLVGRPVVATGLATDSQWFELETRVDTDELPHFRRTLLRRLDGTRIVTTRRRHLYVPDG